MVYILKKKIRIIGNKINDLLLYNLKSLKNSFNSKLFFHIITNIEY